MKVLGIIAEYNPFHMGHAYQINTLKKEINADYTVIAMSGNFVQRGAPAMMEKYSRARMALSCGADLVLELPSIYAAASAEHFARGGVALLESAGVVTHLGFGTETKDFGLLQEIADLLNRQPEPFTKILQQGLKNGLSFPAARSQAVEACLEKEKAAPDEPPRCKHTRNPALASFPRCKHTGDSALASSSGNISVAKTPCAKRRSFAPLLSSICQIASGGFKKWQSAWDNRCNLLWYAFNSLCIWHS